ncbi:MAG TPA: aspartate--tRNA(Asn) ligase [candidate division Zixibacteria bacterium]|nr:aspartate--tRNA(Asn) ligase [candidate division Zixibacteria bacterium]
MVNLSSKIPIKEIKKLPDGTKVSIGGWAEHLVHKGKICFVTVRDSTGHIQITGIQTKVTEDIWEKLITLKNETIVWIEGIIKKNQQAPDEIEILPEYVEILNTVQGPIPIDITGRTPMDEGTIYSFRELTIRMPLIKAPFEVKGFVAQATREFFTKKGFTEIFTPLIVATATEGGASLFPLKYFDQDAYLAQSGQFYKQASITAHEKVFGLIPSFRMEKSRTRKHVSEFWQIEVEAAFYDHISMMQLLEDMLVSVVNRTIKLAQEPLELLGATPRKLKGSFPRIPFKKAKELCTTFDLEESVNFNEDFTSPEETALSKYHKTPFFITEWPTHTRGIYYRVNDDDPNISNSFDLIAPDGFVELCTGGQRVHEYDKMVEVIKNQGFSLDSYSWYLNLFKYGIPPHAGYGLGIERLAWWICGLDNIKQAIMFPRTVDILKP